MPGDTRKLRTLHFFLVKKLLDNEDVEGGLMLVGTFVQRVFDLTEKEAKEQVKESKAHFKYRFNESSKGETHIRRTEPLKPLQENDENGKPKTDENGDPIYTWGTRTTFEVTIPLEIDSLLSAFPFQVNLATASIELSSLYSKDSTCKLRSNLLIHKTDSRYSIAYQDKENDESFKEEFGLENKKWWADKNAEKTEQLVDATDKTKVYEMLSPYPEVCYEYQEKKGYCPRFVLTFYVAKPGFRKLVTILLPMMLVTVLAILNVRNDRMTDCGKEQADGDCIRGEDAVNHLQVTSALTLAIVFVLPQILNDDSNRDELFTNENISIIVFFLSLVLASFPRSLHGYSAGTEIVGVVLMALSTLLLPLYNCHLYYKIKKKIEAKALRSTENKQFLKDDSHEEWKEELGLANFCTVDAFFDGSTPFPTDLYTVKTPILTSTKSKKPKITRLRWNTLLPKEQEEQIWFLPGVQQERTKVLESTT